MSPWVFVLMLFLPSFGGPVKATIEAQDEASCNQLRKLVIDRFGGEVRATIRTADQASCERLRRIVVQHFGGEQNMNGMVSPCAPEGTP